MPKELPQLQTLITKATVAANKSELIGVFNCQGELSEEIAENLKNNKNEELRKFGSLRSATLGLPTENDFNKLTKFTQNILKENTK